MPEASNPTAVPIPAPTMLPTTNTLSMELHGADGHLVPLWKSGDGGYLAAGEAVSGTLRFTGDEDQSRQVTIRLCRGEAVAGPDLCTDRDGKFVAEVAFMQQFAYEDARRKMLNNVSPAGTAAAETQTYVTGAFTVYDYAPTPAPTPRPSTAAPSNVKAGPTMNPTYEPTAKPVEEIPCTATVESGIPDDKIWEWGQDVELKIKMCHWYSYSYGVVDVLLYGDVAGADPVDSLAQYQSVHDNTLTVRYTVPQCSEPETADPTSNYYGRCKTTGLNFPDNTGAATCGTPPCYKLRIIEYGHCFDTALFAGTGAANQVEMNKIRKFSSYGAGTDLATTPLAPGDSIFANVEYWPLDRYSSGRGTARGGTFHKATAKEGQLRWSEDNDQGRFVYPFVDGPIATTDGGALGSGIA